MDSLTTSPSEASTTTVCVFLVGDQRYGLDIGLCGEIVVLDRVAPVPLAQRGVLGVFSLRGAPTALVDLAQLLGLPTGEERTRSRAVLVLRGESGTLCGAPIQRVESVTRVGPEHARSASAGTENPAVGGFIETETGVVTLIDPRTLLERLEALRHHRTEE
jgi:chemotaxis signal transduction protein